MVKTPTSSIDPLREKQSDDPVAAVRDMMEQHISELKHEIDDLVHHLIDEEDAQAHPLYWGWSLDLDDEATPIVTTFGNLRERFAGVAQGFSPPGLVWSIDTDTGTVQVTAELADVDHDAVDVTIEGGTVTVDAEGEHERYKASCTLPLTLEPDEAKASFDEGTLTIEIPFTPQPEAEPVKVPVTSREG